MITLTPALLVAAIGCPREIGERWAGPLAEACRLFGIDRPARVAAFLAQIGHESQSLTRTVENLNYRADRIRELAADSPLGSRWRSLAPRADALARNPRALAEAAYGGRMGNGKEGSGDGWAYRGRGLKQVTGRANYQAATEGLRAVVRTAPDFEAEPDLLAADQWAALSAGWYWHERDLSPLADAGQFDVITQRINNGQNGRRERRALYARATKAVAA